MPFLQALPLVAHVADEQIVQAVAVEVGGVDRAHVGAGVHVDVAGRSSRRPRGRD